MELAPNKIFAIVRYGEFGGTQTIVFLFSKGFKNKCFSFVIDVLRQFTRGMHRDARVLEAPVLGRRVTGCLERFSCVCDGQIIVRQHRDYFDHFTLSLFRSLHSRARAIVAALRGHTPPVSCAKISPTDIDGQ